MKIGIMLGMAGSDGPGRVPTFDEVLTQALRVEDAGLDSIWVCDHLLSHPTDVAPAEGILEAWTLLAALAARTERVELGQLVTCVSFRNPAILAKMATTVDEISDGRVSLGLGAGWDDREYRTFGVPIDHRVDRFEEALQVIVPLLRGERVTIDGTYHRADDLVLLPRPARRIPILIAADGPRMLRLTARHADAWNTAWYGAPSDALQAKLVEMDVALEAEGRDPAGLRRTVGMSVVDPERPVTNEVDPDALAGTVEDLSRAFDAYEALGIDDLIVLPEPNDVRSVDRLARANALRG
jgi:alkanesulfonate monooxygenase SsuD/methylene tetrahydromethanopterin reductase-like flavin-dependent oxidoreductase (luciferase family)